MDDGAGTTAVRAPAVIGTSFTCLDAPSMTWVAGGGEGDIIDLYGDCLAAVRG